MKRNLLILTFNLILAATFNGLAQPTITATGLNPVVGDHFTSNNAAYIAPGNAGANQTWDLSSLTATATATVTALTVASTPYASSFPYANVASNDGTSTYGYTKTSSTVWQNMGSVVIVSGNPLIMSYADPEDFIHYPCAYSNTFTDSWATSFFTSGYNWYRTGSTTVTADGYGTLKTPAGTFINVMRLHLVENYQDSAWIGFSYLITYQNDEYLWVMNGVHNSLAAVSSLTSSVSGPTQVSVYLSNINGIEETTSVIKSFSVYPNPAVDFVTLDLGLTSNEVLQVKVLDIVGKEQGKSFLTEGVSGHNEIKINVQDLSEGIYLAQIMAGNATISTRRFSVVK